MDELELEEDLAEERDAFQLARLAALAEGCAPGSSSSRTEDEDLLSDLCQWRSCVCRVPLDTNSRAKRKSRPLCAWHAKLKRFLDDHALLEGTPSDAQRFVAKVPSSSQQSRRRRRANDSPAAGASPRQRRHSDRGAEVKASSPLLTELANGKTHAAPACVCV